VSPEARLAMFKGAAAMCPGCLLEKEIPDHPAACHEMPNGSKYECHEGLEAWENVPEWIERGAPND